MQCNQSKSESLKISDCKHTNWGLGILVLILELKTIFLDFNVMYTFNCFAEFATVRPIVINKRGQRTASELQYLWSIEQFAKK